MDKYQIGIMSPKFPEAPLKEPQGPFSIRLTLPPLGALLLSRG